jgi:hypothetical protein
MSTENQMHPSPRLQLLSVRLTQNGICSGHTHPLTPTSCKYLCDRLSRLEGSIERSASPLPLIGRIVDRDVIRDVTERRDLKYVVDWK